jgi:membrane fusion protein (multidrug efflux system)
MANVAEADVVERDVVDELSKSEASTQAAQPRKNLGVKLLLVGAVLVLGAAAAWAWFHFRDRVSSDDAQVDGHIVAIAPKVSGNVLDVSVVENLPVKAGQILLRIDPRDYQAKVDMAKAALQQAESQLRSAQVLVPWENETTQSGASTASAQLANAMAELQRARLTYEQASSSDIAYAEANVRSKEANSQRAQADLARMKPLVDKAEISQQQYDSFLAAARMAENDWKAAQENLSSVQKDAGISQAGVDAAQSKVTVAQSQVENSLANRKQVDVRKADEGTAGAAVAAARASLEAAVLQLSYTTIVAPADGVVTRKSVEPGQIVQPGQGLMTIIPLQDVWVTANFKETQLAKVRPGQPAEISVDMYGGRTVHGHVDSISGATGSRLSLLPAENATGNFVKVVQRIPVKILVDRSEGLVLRPGMNVDATIFTR